MRLAPGTGCRARWMTPRAKGDHPTRGVMETDYKVFHDSAGTRDWAGTVTRIPYLVRGSRRLLEPGDDIFQMSRGIYIPGGIRGCVAKDDNGDFAAGRGPGAAFDFEGSRFFAGKNPAGISVKFLAPAFLGESVGFAPFASEYFPYEKVPRLGHREKSLKALKALSYSLFVS